MYRLHTHESLDLNSTLHIHMGCLTAMSSVLAGYESLSLRPDGKKMISLSHPASSTGPVQPLAIDVSINRPFRKILKELIEKYSDRQNAYTEGIACRIMAI